MKNFTKNFLVVLSVLSVGAMSASDDNNNGYRRMTAAERRELAHARNLVASRTSQPQAEVNRVAAQAEREMQAAFNAAQTANSEYSSSVEDTPWNTDTDNELEKPRTSHETFRSSDDAAPYEDGPTIFDVMRNYFYPKAVEIQQAEVITPVVSEPVVVEEVVTFNEPVLVQSKQKSFVRDHAYEIGAGAGVVAVVAMTYVVYQNWDKWFKRK